MNNKEYLDKGIVHFWDLPHKLHIKLKYGIKNKILSMFMDYTKTYYGANKITNISRPTIKKYNEEKYPLMRIDFLLNILDVIKSKNISLSTIEKNTIWIGDYRSPGIVNPNLPFSFNSRQGTRFLAGICNEGWISDGMYYSNSKKELRKSMKYDANYVFGGDNSTVKDWVKEKDQYLAFPSVIRDAVCLITNFKGIKSENNPPIPAFISKSKDLIYGWIEQTIGDEGHVKYYPKTYRREIIWRRSCDAKFSDCRLILDEISMLDKIGIKYDLKKIGTYETKLKKRRFRSQIRISRKNNLKKLLEYITIPDKFKSETFILMLKGC